MKQKIVGNAALSVPKKLLSIILSLVMMFSITTTSNLFAYAGGWLDTVKEAELNTTYSESCSTKEPVLYDGGTKAYMEAYSFEIPCNGTITINVNSHNKKYLSDVYYQIYDENFESTLAEGWAYNIEKINYNSAIDTYYGNESASLNAGKYYFVIEYYDLYEYYSGTYDITFNYKPNISTPSSLKVSTRNANSLKLSWSKVANVSGYQLQYKSGDSYKTITNTTSTTVTVKNLSSATNYKFRVRAYKTIDGKKYYGSWKYLTTPTKPSKVSIKSPSTNSKHQIIAKWNKVTRASGYQVQYCKNSSCSNVVATKTVSGGSKTSYTGKNFTKGKKYYVRVRAYKTIDGTKYYGAWSSVKSIKCK